VREAGDRDHCSGIAAGQRASGTQSRHTSGPLDQEDETEEDSDARAGQYLLQQEYLPEHNQRFRQAAAEAEDYHRQGSSAAELREVFRLESERIISNDWVVRYDKRLFQVQAQSRKYAPAQGKVVVCQWQDGTVEIEYRGCKLPWKEISSAPPRVSAALAPSPLFRVAACATP
jgi:hypothetical protein